MGEAPTLDPPLISYTLVVAIALVNGNSKQKIWLIALYFTTPILQFKKTVIIHAVAIRKCKWIQIEPQIEIFCSDSDTDTCDK